MKIKDSLRQKVEELTALARGAADHGDDAKAATYTARAKAFKMLLDNEEALDRGEQPRANEALAAAFADLARLNDVEGTTGSLYDAFKQRGFVRGQKAVVTGWDFRKAIPLEPGTTSDELAVAQVPGTAMGADTRFIADVFPSINTGAALAVDVVRQSGRTLPDSADVSRSPTATTPKAEVDSELEQVHTAMEQLAVVHKDVPNALLEIGGIRQIVDTDLSLAIRQAEDAEIVDAINAAIPPSAGFPGTDLTAQIVYAAADMADDGYNGSVVLISPVDFAELSLLRGADEQFARNDPLAGFRFVQSNSIAADSPIMVDPSASVRLYRGALSLSAHEQDAGQTNLSTVRMEELFLAAVERANAIRLIGPSGS